MAATWLKNIFNIGAEKLVSEVGDLYTTAQENHLGKKELLLKLREIADQNASRMHDLAVGELEAKRSIIVSELAQEDKYVKRMRPTAGYMGMAMIFLTYTVIPLVAIIVGRDLSIPPLPEEFWWSWTGVMGIYVLSRSAEKLGKNGPVVNTVTGRGSVKDALREELLGG